MEFLSEAEYYQAIEIIRMAKSKSGGKYSHINFKPPKSVADAAASGLRMRERAGGKGGLSSEQAGKSGVGSGVQRAVNLKNRDTLSPGTVRRMKAFFDRHAKNKKVEPGKAPHEDKGRVAWMLWGGDPGYAWAKKIVKQMEAADKKDTNDVFQGKNSLESHGTSDAEAPNEAEALAIQLGRPDIAQKIDDGRYLSAAEDLRYDEDDNDRFDQPEIKHIVGVLLKIWKEENPHVSYIPEVFR